MIDDEEPEYVEREGQTLKVLRTDAPPLRRDVAYTIDRTTMDAATAVSRLNQLGPIGVLEKRMRYDKLVSQLSAAEYELAIYARECPWATAPMKQRDSRQLLMLTFAAVLLLGVIAAMLTRPTLSERSPSETPRGAEHASADGAG